jgi:hypothetical protein
VLCVRNEYLIKISNRFAALENFNNRDNIKRTFENVEVNINISAKNYIVLYELKVNNSVNNFRSKKEAKMRWLRDANQNNVYKLYKVTRKASGSFRKSDEISGS